MRLPHRYVSGLLEGVLKPIRATVTSRTALCLRPVALVLGLFLVFCLLSGTAASTSAADDKPTGVSSVLTALLSEVFDNSEPGPEANELVARATVAAPNDWRVHYAIGLVALRKANRAQSLASFEEAVRTVGDTKEKVAVERAHAWLLMVRGRRNDALAVVRRLGLNVIRGGDPDAAFARQTVTWSAAFLTAAEDSSRRQSDAQAVRSIIAEIEKQTGFGRFENAWLTGRETVYVKTDMANRDAQTLKRQREIQEKRGAEIQSRETEKKIDRAKEDRKKSVIAAADMQASFQESLSRLDAELSRLGKDYEALEQQSLSIAEGQKVLQKRALELALQVRQGRLSRQNADARYLFLARGNDEYLGEQRAVQDRVRNTVAAATTLLQQRTALLQEYRKRTGKLQTAQAQTAKWIQRLENKKKDLEKQKTSGALKATAGKRVSIPVFHKLLPFDFAWHRACLNSVL